MQAIVIERYGSNEVLALKDRPKPTVGSNDVLIEVFAAGVNPIDWKIRAGKLKAILSLELPAVLGSEASGIVVEVGEAVRGVSLGDAVIVRVATAQLGAFAEYLAVDASLVAPKPSSLSHVEAAGLPLVGLTAWQALHDVAGLAPKQRVLVHAGAGGVGSLAIQIAVAHGAEVTATASKKNHDFVRGLGASEVIDYRKDPFEDHGGDYDVVLDTVGADTLTRSFKVVRPGGTLVTIAAAMPDGATMRALGHPVLAVAMDLLHWGNYRRARKQEISFRYLFMHGDGKQLGQLSAMVDEGRLRATVDRVVPLSEVGAAFEYSESGRARGKIVVAVKPDVSQ